MRTAAMIAVVILGQMFALGQKRTDPNVRKSTTPAHSMPKSVDADAVAAALRTNTSSTANELAKIEQQNAKPTYRPPVPKPKSPTAALDLGKNKPMKFSSKPRKP
jgi:hypothetical protein